MMYKTTNDKYRDHQTMTAEEFKKSWTREASEQPGMILDVLPAPVLPSKKKGKAA